MCSILADLQKYVPTITTKERMILPDGEEYNYEEDNMMEVLFGGDQLTVTRARSAIGIRRTHESNKEKLLGLIPVIEDWHARQTLMQVSMTSFIPVICYVRSLALLLWEPHVLHYY